MKNDYLYKCAVDIANYVRKNYGELPKDEFAEKFMEATVNAMYNNEQFRKALIEAYFEHYEM